MRFWKDEWCDYKPLCTTFHSLLAIVASKKASVQNVWNLSNDLSGLLNDWEVEIMERFLMRLQGRRVCGEEEDKVIWKRLKNGRFSIKVLYSALEPRSTTFFFQ